MMKLCVDCIYVTNNSACMLYTWEGGYRWAQDVREDPEMCGPTAKDFKPAEKVPDYVRGGLRNK